MASVLLIYPYFKPDHDRSVFRFPPLGSGYIAAALRNAGHQVKILDCTFLDRPTALSEAAHSGAEIIGIYSMITMQDESLWFARQLRGKCKLLVSGGPLPTSDPLLFTDDFDVVVAGEGEQTMVELANAFSANHNWETIDGLVYRNKNSTDDKVVFNQPRQMETDLNKIAFPARDLFQNQKYIEHGKKRYGLASTSVITTRGCPFTCEFCSRSVFGVSYRERSPQNMLDEVEQALALGYDSVHFADDVFTLNKTRIPAICDEIEKRKLKFKWQCLGRVDSIDPLMAQAMRKAGCERIFFGIESGNDEILKLMNKRITAAEAERAVRATHAAGIKAAAFFILCYPGETNRTVLKTIRFATSLPLDYLSFTSPYPLPGTALHERLRDKIRKEWKPKQSITTEHTLIYDSDFSEAKMRFAIIKGKIEFRLGKILRRPAAWPIKPFELATDELFRLMK